MSTITACQYSPDKSPLNRLNPNEVNDLNKEGDHDISEPVKKIVQKHLGYKGTKKFSTEFTRQKITFTLKSDKSENRTLEKVHGIWMLSKNGAAASHLDPALEKEVDALIHEVLSQIRQAHRSAPSSPIASDTPDSKPSESSIQAPLTESLQTQRNILGELRHLSHTLSQRSSEPREEQETFQRKIAELEDDLSEAKEALERQLQYQELHNEHFDHMQSELGASRRQFKSLKEERDQQDIASKELRKKLEELETSKCEAVATLQQTQEQLQVLQERTDQEKAQLEETLRSVQLELTPLKQALGKARLELEGLKKQQAQIDKKAGEVEGAKEKTVALAASIAEKEAQLRELETSRVEAIAKQKAVEAKLMQTQAQHQAFQERTAQEKAQLQKQLAAAQSAHTQSIEQNASAIAEVQAQLKEKASATQSLEEQIARSKAELKAEKQAHQKDRTSSDEIRKGHLKLLQQARQKLQTKDGVIKEQQTTLDKIHSLHAEEMIKLQVDETKKRDSQDKEIKKLKADLEHERGLRNQALRLWS